MGPCVRSLVGNPVVAKVGWKCRKCPTRNEPRKRKCVGCGSGRPRARKTAKLKPVDSYQAYREINRAIHGVDEECGVCGKERSQSRHHDRDHDHVTGRPRGLACGGNRGCNVLMAKWITADVARAIAAVKAAQDAPDAERWSRISAYLGRVEGYYQGAANELAQDR